MRILASLIISLLLPICAFAQRETFYGQNVTTAGGSGPQFVESKGATTNGSTNTISVSLGTNTTSANEDIGVAIVSQTVTTGCAAGTLSSVTDSGSQAYSFIWGTVITGFGQCIEMWHKSASAAGISSVTVTLNTSNHLGGAIVWHFKNILTGNDGATTSAPSATSQGTPWTGAAETSATIEAMVAITVSDVTTFNSGIQNAQLYTGSWIQGYTICSQSGTAPCTGGSSGHIDGNSGEIFGFAYQVIAPSSLANTGTNNGSTNVYKNFPGIAGFK